MNSAASAAADPTRPATAEPDRPGQPPPPPPPETEGAREPFLQAARSVLAELPALFSDRVHLLALESRRAGLALAQILMLVVGAAVLGVTAWLALWLGVAGLLIEIGLGWGWALLIVLLLNVAAMALALLRVKKLASLLSLPATVRRLTVSPSTQPRAPAHEPVTSQPPRAHATGA